MNYTKGDWKAHDELIETDFAPMGAVIAVVNKATKCWEPNSLLIAAAPKMYNALKLACEVLRVKGEEGIAIHCEKALPQVEMLKCETCKYRGLDPEACRICRQNQEKEEVSK